MKRNGKYDFTWVMGTIAGLALSLPLMMVAPAVLAADITTSPPAKFKKVSSLVKLPVRGGAAHTNRRTGRLHRARPAAVQRG